MIFESVIKYVHIFEQTGTIDHPDAARNVRPDLLHVFFGQIKLVGLEILDQPGR